MLQDSHLTFDIDGDRFPLTDFSFAHSIDTFCGSFEARTGGISPDRFFAKVGKIIQIKAGGLQRECILDVVSFCYPSEITISGRDKTSLLVDSSASCLNFPSNQSFLSLAKKLSKPFEIDILDPDNLGGFNVKDFSVSAGDTGHEALSESALKGGVFLSTDDGKSLVIRSTAPRKEQYTIGEDSPVLGLSMARNVSDVFGSYILIKDSTELFEAPIKLKLKDNLAHPLKQKRIKIDKSDSPQQTLVLEAMTRRRRSLAIEIVMSGCQSFPLGARMDLDLKGLNGTSGIVSQIEYSLSPMEEITRICLGGI